MSIPVNARVRAVPNFLVSLRRAREDDVLLLSLRHERQFGYRLPEPG